MNEEATPDDILAAEYALGLLEGEQLLAVRGREASDPGFAAEVAQWQARLAPLLDTIDPQTPREVVWLQIERELGQSGDSAEIISLSTRLRRWRWQRHEPLPPFPAWNGTPAVWPCSVKKPRINGLV